MTLESAVLLAIAICLLTAKPGPGMLAVISRALSHGFLPAFALSVGIVTIQAFFFSLSIMSFTIIESDANHIANFMKAIAAVYMFFLGIKGILNYKKSTLFDPNESKSRQVIENYIAGLMITLSNPFVILFYVVVVPAILDMDNLLLFDKILALFIIVGLNLALLSLEALAATQIRELLKDKGVTEKINLFTSLCFIAVGLFLTYSLFPVFVAELGFANI